MLRSRVADFRAERGPHRRKVLPRHSVRGHDRVTSGRIGEHARHQILLRGEPAVEDVRIVEWEKDVVNVDKDAGRSEGRSWQYR